MPKFTQQRARVSACLFFADIRARPLFDVRRGLCPCVGLADPKKCMFIQSKFK